MSESAARPADHPHDGTVAAFVTPHGFGHAARTAAVLEALRRREPGLGLHIFTTTPRWFFADSLGEDFAIHPLACDIGLVQKSSLVEDPVATADALDRFLPFESSLLSDLAALLARLDCRLLLADISPLGLAVAQTARIPSVLVESFTWDWIYRAYFDAEPRLRHHAEHLAGIYETAGLRIQTEPFCSPAVGALRRPPVSRPPQSDRAHVRGRLELDDDRPLILLTMGGVEWRYESLAPLRSHPEYVFVIPGATDSPRVDSNLRLLPHRSTFHHADLVTAADTLVGKLGYSTVAEANHAGTPFLYVQRTTFPESPYLARFVEEKLPCREITPEEFTNFSWLDHLPTLLAAPRAPTRQPNGADLIAGDLIASRI